MNFSGRYQDIIKPEKIHVLSISMFLDKVVDKHGGVGANISRTLALLGEKPILVGSVGPDAEQYMEKLSKTGVDVEHVNRSKKPTASFNVLTDSDQNQIGGFHPGAMSDGDNQSLEKWKGDDVFIVISPHDPVAMRRRVAECKKYNLRMFYDIGQQVITVPKKDLVDAINTAELLILNEYEISMLAERVDMTTDEILKKIPVVVVTKGKNGSEITGKNVKRKIEVPVARPISAVDPTGAGDSFRAGFLMGYVRGLDLEMCGKLGAVSSVYAVETHGTQDFTFTKTEYIKRYADNFNEKIII